MVILLILPAYGTCLAQFPPESDSSFSEYLAHDSALTEQVRGSYYVDRSIDSIQSQNPTIALFKSVAIPGWGQISNGKYVKAGTIIALETTLIGTYVHYRNKTEDARNAFENATLEDKPSLYNNFEDAKDQRNRFAWYCATMIFISMFDAYVDAHLARFPKRHETISFNIGPTPDESVRVSLAYHF